MYISFNELRNLKDSLPDGAMKQIAQELDVATDTVRNYFGGANYQKGQVADIHYEKGANGGAVFLEDLTIYERAKKMVEQAQSQQN